MEKLVKQLTYLKDLIKAIKAKSGVATIPALPSIKPPAPPSIKASVKPTKIPGSGPDSKKDPRKVAQQIKDGSMSTKTQKIMFKSQWSDEDIEKADKLLENKLYHIHQGPHRITSKPISLKEIKAQHGSVQKLENSGFRLIQHEEKPTEIKKADPFKVNPKDPVLNDAKFPPKAQSPEKLKESQAKLDQYLKNKKLKKNDSEVESSGGKEET